MNQLQRLKTLNSLLVLFRRFPSPSARTPDRDYSVLQAEIRVGNPTFTGDPSENRIESGSVRKIEP